MDTLVHCQHCQEDTNTADWEANQGVCPHCGKGTEPQWSALLTGGRRAHTLGSLRRRLELQPLLRSRSVYAH